MCIFVIMSNIFQIFGSKSSTDYDVMVFVDKIPSIEDSKFLCKKWNKKLYMMFIDNGMEIKTLNCNLAVLTDGEITAVHKGTSDECNNSCLLTYDFHKQFHEQQITRLVERDVDIKIMRSIRFILMYLSRSDYRFDVKVALKSNFIKKLKTLERIDLSNTTELGKSSVDWVDYLKSVSFQLGQSIALMDDKEFYTKEELCKEFPDLEPMLMRTGQDLTIIEKYKEIFIRMSKLRLKDMSTYDEYKK